MKNTYEDNIRELIAEQKPLSDKNRYSIFRYFWESSLFYRNRIQALPYYLKRVSILKNFSENELRILANYLHIRTFQHKEQIFNKGDRGIGLYLIFNGKVEISFSSSATESSSINLQRYDHFGEMALIEENCIRTAKATAQANTTLLGIFRPDIESLIYEEPIIGAKLLESLAKLLASKFTAMALELKSLKMRYEEK